MWTQGRWVAFAAAVCSALFGNMTSAAAAGCGASYTINLTVELSPEFTNRQNNVLVELRQGVVGNSKVADKKEFAGSNGVVAFKNLCSGSYFIAIGNGDKVAVGPIHVMHEGQHLASTIRVSFSQGNVSTMSRSRL